MSYVVYGIRIRGDKEVRYVGQTSQAPITRLQKLPGEHGGKWGDSLFAEWLLLHHGQLEAFEIAGFETRAEAKATERVVIALCIRLNHRLFNCDHVPREHRSPARLAA